MVGEEFRHLDTNIVLSLVKARADVNTFASTFTGGTVDWFKELSSIYNYFRWDDLLPWEAAKKNMTIISFAEAASSGLGSQNLGPITLRKSISAINVLYIDMAKQKLPMLRYNVAYVHADQGGFGAGMTSPSVASAMKNVNNMFTSLTSQMDKKPTPVPLPMQQQGRKGGNGGGGGYEDSSVSGHSNSNSNGSRSKSGDHGHNHSSNGNHHHPSEDTSSHDSSSHSGSNSSQAQPPPTAASAGSSWSSYLSTAASAAAAATSGGADGTKGLFKTMSSMWGSKTS